MLMFLCPCLISLTASRINSISNWICLTSIFISITSSWTDSRPWSRFQKSRVAPFSRLTRLCRISWMIVFASEPRKSNCSWNFSFAQDTQNEWNPDFLEMAKWHTQINVALYGITHIAKVGIDLTDHPWKSRAHHSQIFFTLINSSKRACRTFCPSITSNIVSLNLPILSCNAT